MINIQSQPIVLQNPGDGDLVSRDLELLTNTLSNRRNNNALAYATLEKDENNLNDFISRYDSLSFTNVGKEVQMSINSSINKDGLRMHKNAISQSAAKLGIDGRFISKLQRDNSEWAKNLLAYTLNSFTKNARKGDKGLIRAVGDEVRGMVSDSYHRYSTGDVYHGLLTEYKDKAYMLNTQYNGLTSYLELVSNKMRSFYLDGKLVNMVFGLQIRNSSFGLAALDVRPFSMKVVCGNGMTTKHVMREIHRTGRSNAYGFLSNETLALEAKVNTRYVLDAADTIFSDGNIDTQIRAMSDLSSIKVDDGDIQQLSKFKVRDTEIAEVMAIILGGKEDDGLLGNHSAYDMSQAISKVAQSKPLEREKELLDVSGNFMQQVIDNYGKK